MTTAYVTKGSRVQVRRFVVQDAGTYSIAGAQMKACATAEEFSGVVEKVWGNHPIAPTVITFRVRKDDGATVEVDSKHAVGMG